MYMSIYHNKMSYENIEIMDSHKFSGRGANIDNLGSRPPLDAFLAMKLCSSPQYLETIVKDEGDMKMAYHMDKDMKDKYLH